MLKLNIELCSLFLLEAFLRLFAQNVGFVRPFRSIRLRTIIDPVENWLCPLVSCTLLCSSLGMSVSVCLSVCICFSLYCFLLSLSCISTYLWFALFGNLSLYMYISLCLRLSVLLSLASSNIS